MEVPMLFVCATLFFGTYASTTHFLTDLNNPRKERQALWPPGDWNWFKNQFNKYYADPQEDAMRQAIYENNLAFILQQNNLFDQGFKTYNLGVNHLADMTDAEIAALNGLFPSMTINTVYYNLTNGQYFNGTFNYAGYMSPDQLPPSLDWSSQGLVTPVQDQGNCGSCYAFSAAGALEGQNMLGTGNLVQLSAQNIVDCSSSYGNFGCGGGYMSEALRYVADNGGIDSLQAYPYAGVTQSCQYNPQYSAATSYGFVRLPSGDEQILQIALATIGPISIGINANLSSFSYYSSGVYSEPNCSPTSIDHGVLLVGYGTDQSGNDYWIVKNSWGTDWGMNGYIWVARNQNNMCGVATSPCYPTVPNVQYPPGAQSPYKK